MENYSVYIILFLAGILGGALNAIAGGGGFITFPALIFSGVSQIKANAITTVALWPGGITSAKAFEQDITVSRRTIIYLLFISAIGGLLGGYLLIQVSSSETFESLVPYFLLSSWLMFAFSPAIINYFYAKPSSGDNFKYHHRQFIPIFILSIYGGYFGAGLGMMLLTLFTFYGMKNLNAMNGLKVIMVAVNNGVATIAFIFSGLIQWPFTIVMMVGGLIGGYYGAVLIRRMDQGLVRKIIIIIGGIITLYFFIAKYY